MLRIRCFRSVVFSFLIVVILLSGCTGRHTVILDKPLPADSSANAAALRKGADLLWKKRDDPQRARQALALYRRAFAAAPTDTVLGTRLARAFFFVGIYVENDRKARDSLFLRGTETGERVLALNAEFLSVYRKSKDDKRALAVLDQSWINPIYWTATNLGGWTSSQKRSVRYGNKQRLEVFMTRVKELDPNFFYGAVPRFFGVLYTQGREPFVNLDNAKREFDRALEMAPNFFANQITYAATYAVRKKDRELFEKLLKQVVDGKPNALPDVEPENKYEQAIAKKLLARIDEYFEKK